MDRPVAAQLYVGVVLFALNVLLAWGLLAYGTWHVASSLQHAAPSELSQDALSRHAAHVVNGQVIRMAILALGFAMTSAGFALFVLGARGSLAVDAEVGERGKLLLRASAPGLVCFLLATGLAVATLAFPTKMESADGTSSSTRVANVLGPAPLQLNQKLRDAYLPTTEESP